MSLRSANFEDAKAAHRPMRRTRMLNTASPARQKRNAASDADKPIQTGRGLITRKPMARGKKAATKPKRKKKLTDGQLKKRVWVQFSIFIRTRGADENGMNQCYTCDRWLHWKHLEAGHLVPGRTNSVLFQEDAVRPQCRRCNGHFRGNTIVYYPKLVAALGQDEVDRIVAQRDVTHKWEVDELPTLFAKYKALNDANPVVKCESP